VLAKWRADVTRVLTEENARAEIKSVHLKLVAAAYNFLHRYVAAHWTLKASSCCKALTLDPRPADTGSSTSAWWPSHRWRAPPTHTAPL
jgi:hypothetical protein